MLKAEYQTRGPVPQDVIEAVPFETPELDEGQVLLEMLAAPINSSDILTLTGQYGILPPCPLLAAARALLKWWDMARMLQDQNLAKLCYYPLEPAHGQLTWLLMLKRSFRCPMGSTLFSCQ